MAKFFDPKEDVMDIKITPYGHHLLSKGDFKPAFYAFYDDDIIYDIKYTEGELSEPQSDIETRIQAQTPRMKVQSGFSGVETNIKRTVQQVKEKKAKLGDNSLQPMADKHHALALPLGHSSLSTVHMPSWDMFFLRGKMDDSVTYLTGSTTPNIRIPQVDCNITYTGKATGPDEPVPLSEQQKKVIQLEGSLPDNETVGAWSNTFDGFEDMSNFKVIDDFILLEINENNTDYLSENFDIEVYEVVSVTGSQKPNSLGNNEHEELVPLYFARDRWSDLSTLYTTDEVDDFDELFPDLDPNYVEHFFDVLVDDEIDPAVICMWLPDSKVKRRQLAREFDCPDKKSQLGSTFSDAAAGLYDAQITTDPEDCD